MSNSAFEARFAPLYATVFTEGGSFSGRAMSADLHALEPLLPKTGTTVARDAFRLYHTQASVFGRRDMPKEAASAAQKALAAASKSANLSLDPSLAYAEFFLRYASIRWLADAQQYTEALALVHGFQKQYPLASIASLPVEMQRDNRQTPPLTKNFPSQMQMLGVYEDEGYILHEQGKFREAQQVNARLLPFARERLKALGMPERLRGVLANIAQNSYSLGELAQAQTYLQERLQIAITASDDATIYDCYFQLMVLAHEQNQADKARDWLSLYQQRAEKQKDTAQLERVKALQAQLKKRPPARAPS